MPMHITTELPEWTNLTNSAPTESCGSDCGASLPSTSRGTARARLTKIGSVMYQSSVAAFEKSCGHMLLLGRRAEIGPSSQEKMAARTTIATKKASALDRMPATKYPKLFGR